MQILKDKRGFSLLEVTLVLAISAGMLAMVVGVYSIRRNFVDDDAAKQIESSIQAVRNEAQKGLGPNDTSKINPGETFFGEAIGFTNDNCSTGDSSKSCLYIFKVVLPPPTIVGGRTVQSSPRPYDSYPVYIPQSFAFNLINSGDCSQFLTCYKEPGASSYSSLDKSPISSLDNGTPIGVVVKNGLGDGLGNGLSGMYVFKGGASTEAFNPESYKNSSRQGTLRLAVAQILDRTKLLDQSTWENAERKYYIYIDLSGNNQTRVERYTP